MSKSSVSAIKIQKHHEDSRQSHSDLVAVEEPLEIKLQYGPEHQREERTLAIIMRTPGNDEFLTLGFLFSEGIIKGKHQVLSIRHCHDVPSAAQHNVIMAKLHPQVEPPWDLMQRHLYMSSSCGVCGKTSLDAVFTTCPWDQLAPGPQVDLEVLYTLPDTLKELQLVFNRTGGLHAAAFFTAKGEPLLWQEDIGRHNALDKVIGAVLQGEKLPADDLILLVSGRIGFELVQKAVMAGVLFMAGVGAPSSLAVELAEQHQMTLLGFLRNRRFNCYLGHQRIVQFQEKS